jgi:hypothetical protein
MAVQMTRPAPREAQTIPFTIPISNARVHNVKCAIHRRTEKPGSQDRVNCITKFFLGRDE